MRGVIKGMLGPQESNGSLSWDGNGSFGSRDGSVTAENRVSFRDEETKTNPQMIGSQLLPACFYLDV